MGGAEAYRHVIKWVELERAPLSVVAMRQINMTYMKSVRFSTVTHLRNTRHT